jgi:D-aminoacyl-tRNA deacylase
MKVVVQRVNKAKLRVGERLVSEIGHGYFVLAGIKSDDGFRNAELLAEKLAKLRVMADEEGKMNRSVGDAGGEMLVVSQFTLYGDTRGGNRPSFVEAAKGEVARPIYERLIDKLRECGVVVKTGEFGADMRIDAELDGPVTILIDL